MSLTRLTSTLGAGAVAGIAAWSSWSHMVSVALRVGERPEVAYVLPLSVDGLLVVAAAAMTDDKRAGRTPRISAKVAFGAGVAATIAANIASAHPTWGARAVAAWPAVALLLVVELLSRRGRTRQDTPAATPNEGAHTTIHDDNRAVPPPQRAPRRKAGRRSAADRVAAAARRTPDATAGALAGRLGLSERTVQRHLSALSVDKMPPPRPAPARLNGAEVPLAELQEVRT